MRYQAGDAPHTPLVRGSIVGYAGIPLLRTA